MALLWQPIGQEHNLYIKANDMKKKNNILIYSQLFMLTTGYCFANTAKRSTVVSTADLLRSVLIGGCFFLVMMMLLWLYQASKRLWRPSGKMENESDPVNC